MSIHLIASKSFPPSTPRLTILGSPRLATHALWLSAMIAHHLTHHH
jgi:hypothetical protein